MSPGLPWILRARATTPTALQVEVGRVEEEHLAYLSLERIEAERDDRSAMVGGGHRELQLDAVRLSREGEEPDELLVGQAAGCSTAGHPRSVATPDYAVDVLLYNSAVSGNCYKVRLLLAAPRDRVRDGGAVGRRPLEPRGACSAT